MDPNKMTDLDSVKWTTLSLSNELREMKQMMVNLQEHGTQKDSEIARLSWTLNEQRKLGGANDFEPSE